MIFPSWRTPVFIVMVSPCAGRASRNSSSRLYTTFTGSSGRLGQEDRVNVDDAATDLRAEATANRHANHIHQAWRHAKRAGDVRARGKDALRARPNRDLAPGPTSARATWGSM